MCTFVLSALNIMPAAAQQQAHHATAKQDTVLPQPGYDILNYIATNFKIPGNADPAEWSSRCVVRFKINTAGHPENIVVLRHVSPAFDKETIRLIRAMPPWQPGTVNGKPTSLEYTMPLSLHLE